VQRAWEKVRGDSLGDKLRGITAAGTVTVTVTGGGYGLYFWLRKKDTGRKTGTIKETSEAAAGVPEEPLMARKAGSKHILNF
jgi:hypothetical protein